ncbi:MAG: nuclear transport factor 2 family protein [Bacteroidota bacterium]
MKGILVAIAMMTAGMGHAQQAETEVKHTLQQLFVAMGNGDSASASVLFDPRARLMSVVTMKDGKTRLDSEPVSEFMKQIQAKKPGETFDERISSYDIKIDGNLATAWTPYEFYYNGKFSHRGVNAFQLVRMTDEWKIIQITDTRRK